MFWLQFILKYAQTDMCGRVALKKKLVRIIFFSNFVIYLTKQKFAWLNLITDYFLFGFYVAPTL